MTIPATKARPGSFFTGASVASSEAGRSVISLSAGLVCENSGWSTKWISRSIQSRIWARTSGERLLRRVAVFLTVVTIESDLLMRFGVAANRAAALDRSTSQQLFNRSSVRRLTDGGNFFEIFDVAVVQTRSKSAEITAFSKRVIPCGLKVHETKAQGFSPVNGSKTICAT